MVVNFPLLLLALLMLWFPRQWLRLGAVLRKRRAPTTVSEPWRAREAGDPSVDFLTEIAKFRNYVDLLRAAAGGIGVMGGLGVAPSLDIAPGAQSGHGMALLALKSLVLLVGLLLQTVRYEKRRLTFFPPVFYLGGLSVALCTPFGALASFILLWAFSAAVKGPQGLLSIYALLLLVSGQYFKGWLNLSSILAAVLSFLPVLLSLLAQRPLVIFARKIRHPAAPSP